MTQREREREGGRFWDFGPKMGLLPYEILEFRWLVSVPINDVIGFKRNGMVGTSPFYPSSVVTLCWRETGKGTEWLAGKRSEREVLGCTLNSATENTLTCWQYFYKFSVLKMFIYLFFIQFWASQCPTYYYWNYILIN